MEQKIEMYDVTCGYQLELAKKTMDQIVENGWTIKTMLLVHNNMLVVYERYNEK